MLVEGQGNKQNILTSRGRRNHSMIMDGPMTMMYDHSSLIPWAHSNITNDPNCHARWSLLPVKTFRKHGYDVHDCEHRCISGRTKPKVNKEPIHFMTMQAQVRVQIRLRVLTKDHSRSQ